MAQALVTLDLSIAYAVWGALGILLTTCVDKAFFGLRIKPLGFVGIATMISGIVLLKWYNNPLPALPEQLPSKFKLWGLFINFI